jgi:hypothetical protein
MALDRHISIPQFTGAIVVLAGLIFAVYVGTLVGSEDFVLLGIIFVGGFGGVLYFGLFSSYWIWLAFAWAVFGFTIRPFGPAINELIVALGMVTVFVLAHVWRRTPSTEAGRLIQSYFKPFRVMLAIYLVYMALNAFLNMYFPNEPLPVFWGNIAKQQIEMWGGFLLIAAAIRWPHFCRLPSNIGTWIVATLILALVANTVIRAYGTFVLGLGEAQELGMTPLERGRTVLSIPGINLADSPYILRAMAPFGALLGIALWFSTAGANRPAVSRLLSGLLIIASLVAAAFAGGRATVILTVLLPGILLFFQKRFAALLAVAAVGLLMLVGIRYAYDVNHKLIPHMVQRSIALIPGMGMDEARGSIAGSSDWRHDLAMRALNEWSSNTRTLIFGRGVYAFTGQDITAILLDPNQGTLESSLLRGATHNSITDHLLITGLVGLLLYHAVLFSIMWGIYRVLRTRPSFDLVAALCAVFLIQTTVLFLIGFLGSGFFWIISALVASATITLVSRDTPEAKADTPAALREAHRTATRKVYNPSLATH